LPIEKAAITPAQHGTTNEAISIVLMASFHARNFVKNIEIGG
jgi:hypothetical protein